MNKTTHTPGPWTVAPSQAAEVISRHGDAVGLIARPVLRANPEEHKANARLIAAAPELLAALYEALPFVLEGEEFNKPSRKGLSKQIQALIAKAEGKAS